MGTNRGIGVVLLAAAAGACTSLSVTRVEPGAHANGLVYSLPKTFLVVIPKPDGTMEVKFEFLPDQENSYAMDADSLLASHTFQADLEEHGFLTKVVWEPDSTAVPTELVGSAAAAAKQILADREQRRVKAQEKVDGLKGERATLVVEIAKAEGELRTLQYELSFLQAPSSDKAAEIAKQQRQIQEKLLDLKAERAKETPDVAKVAELEREIRLLQFDLDQVLAKEWNRAEIEQKLVEIRKKEEEIALMRSRLETLDRKLGKAKEALDTTQDDATKNAMISGGDAPARGLGPDRKYRPYWGGILFEVLEGKRRDGRAAVGLRPVLAEDTGAAQSAYPTGSVPAAGPSLSIPGSNEVRLPEARPEVITAKRDLELAEAALNAAKNAGNGEAIAAATAARDKAFLLHKAALVLARRNPATLRLTSTAPLPVLDGNEHRLDKAKIKDLPEAVDWKLEKTGRTEITVVFPNASQSLQPGLHSLTIGFQKDPNSVSKKPDLIDSTVWFFVR